MIDYELFEKAREACGCYFTGGVSDDLINKYQFLLQVKFPKSYIQFLKEFGEGGINGAYIAGIQNETFGAVKKHTEKFRKMENLAPELVVIGKGGIQDRKWLICLDTKRMDEDECPVVEYDLSTKKILEYMPDFSAFFNAEAEELYLKAIGQEKMKTNVTGQSYLNSELPMGMGYKTCWMVIEGVSQQKIVDIMLKSNTQRSGYKEGLSAIAKAPYEKHMVMVTADYNNQNYVIGDAVSKVFYGIETIIDLCRDFPKVFVYMTHRVSECHGFALIEHGEITRLYCVDEEDIQNIGEPLSEEDELGMHLPQDFKEMWEHTKDNTITKMDEEVIVELARKQVGIDVKQYPYEPVVIGEMNLKEV